MDMFIDCLRGKPELRDYKSPEKEIIKEKFNTIPYMDVWVSNVIEGYIYKKVSNVDAYGYKTENKMKYNKVSETKQWYKNGQIASEYYYKDGLKDGTHKQWYNNGQPFTYKEYKDGKLEGEFKEWFYNGKLYIQTNYKDGEYQGENKRWYDNGKLFCQKYYKDGILDGEYKEWLPKGTLYIHCYYKNGQPTV